MRRIFAFVFALMFLDIPAFASSPWAHDAWQQRVPFSVDPLLIEGDETFSDFALLVTLDGNRHPAVFADAKFDGSDLLFASGLGGAILKREIVHYDPVGQEAEIWVRVPDLSRTRNTFYLYFDNASANLDRAPVDAWSNEYRAVYHFEENPADLLLTDSSPAGVDIALNPAHGWTSGAAEPGQIGQGWHLNGTTHHISSTAISTVDSSFTIEAWLTHDLPDNSDFFFAAQPGFWYLGSQDQNGSPTYAGPNPNVTVRWVGGGVNIGPPLEHYLWAFDAVDDEVRFYLNGVEYTPFTVFPAGTDPLYRGRLINPDQKDPVGIVSPMFYVPQDFHSGAVDEFRLREGRPSSGQVVTEYRSAADPEAFVSFGPVESAGATSVTAATQLWLRSWPNPSSGPSTVRYSLPSAGHVRIRVHDLAGRETATLVDRRMPTGSWIAQWDGRSRSGAEVAAGVYFLQMETPNGVRSRKIVLIR